MKYNLTVEQNIKGVVTMKFIVNCELDELEEIKEQLIEDLNSGDFQDNDKVEITETFFGDYWQDQDSNKPKIIYEEIKF